MSEMLKKTKMLELRREWTSQDNAFDWAEYQVTGDLRSDILKKLGKDQTLFVTLQERTWAEMDSQLLHTGRETYAVYVYVEEGSNKELVYRSDETHDAGQINRDLFNWVLNRVT